MYFFPLGVINLTVHAFFIYTYCNNYNQRMNMKRGALR